MALLDRIKNIQIDNFQERFSELTNKEKTYFNLMKSQSGVLYLKAKPGVAKSAILKNIADVMGMNYIDIRLSMRDETDVGLFPTLSEYDHEGSTIKVLDHVVPKWAIDANSRPSIIHFEELNRAQPAVMNAALQILLERTIGTEFEFNENVLMVASGNLGDDDGTVVEEFDSALDNRLIHIKHELSTKEWLDSFAEDNIHPDIVAYINDRPGELYKEANDNSPHAYASPRTWTFLSDYIMNTFSKDGSIPTTDEYYDNLIQVGNSFIGVTIVGFIKWLDDRMTININNIINDFENVEEIVSKWRSDNRRDKVTEMVNSLTSISVMDIDKMASFQIDNIVKFLSYTSPEERVSYVMSKLNSDDYDHLDKVDNFIKIISAYKDELYDIININK